MEVTHKQNIFVALSDRRGRLLWANQFPENEDVWYYNRPFFEDIHPDNLNAVKDAFAKCVIDGQTVDLALRAILYESAEEQADKTYHTFQVRFYPCDIEESPHIAVVIVAHVVPEGVSLNDIDTQVLKGLVQDQTIKEIADALDKSQSTIENRIKNLKDRLGVQTLPGLVASAMRSYLV